VVIDWFVGGSYIEETSCSEKTNRGVWDPKTPSEITTHWATSPSVATDPAGDYPTGGHCEPPTADGDRRAGVLVGERERAPRGGRVARTMGTSVGEAMRVRIYNPRRRMAAARGGGRRQLQLVLAAGARGWGAQFPTRREKNSVKSHKKCLAGHPWIQIRTSYENGYHPPVQKKSLEWPGPRWARGIGEGDHGGLAGVDSLTPGAGSDACGWWRP